VHLDYEYSISDLLTLIKSDTNTYNRCEAMKQLIAKMIKEFCASGTLEISDDFVSAFRAVLNDKSLSNWLKADLLTIPSEEELIEGIKKPNFEKIAQARYTIVHRLATSLKDDLGVVYQTLKNTKETQNPQLPEFDIKDAGNRRMVQVCYSYLQNIEPEATTKKLMNEFNVSLGVNMTNTIGALTLLTTVDNQSAETALNTFYHFWKEDVGTINYWFKIQAAAHSTNVVAKVRSLLKHTDFDFYNPNRVYALLGTFIMNPYGFHALDGSGYQLMTECILELDKMNPAVAARLTEAFVNWDNFDDTRGQLMLSNLKLINEKAVSADVRTIAKKGLDKAQGSSPLPIKLTFLSPPKESGTKTGVMDAACIDLSP
jgi:aminopeptidase N